MDLLRAPDDRPAAPAAAPDAVQTKLAVTGQVATRTPLPEAARIMAATGYRCAPMPGARYADHAGASGTVEPRGPIPALRCTPAGTGPARRWVVMFEDGGGRVAYVGVTPETGE